MYYFKSVHRSTRQSLLIRICVSWEVLTYHTLNHYTTPSFRFLSRRPSLSTLTSLPCNRVNIIEGEPANRSMTTGLHTVRDISCSKCNTILGWKYGTNHFRLASAQIWSLTLTRPSRMSTDKAFDSSQVYKEGKFILEKQRFVEVK